MEIKGHAIQRFLSEKPLATPYMLLHGQDAGKISEYVKKLSEAILEGNQDPFARVQVESQELAETKGRLLDEVNTQGLFGGERLIHIKLSGQKQITNELKILLSLDIRNSFVIIEAGDLRKGHSVRTLFEKAKNAASIACYQDNLADIEMLISQICATRGISIEKQLIRELSELLGSDRLACRQEIEKLCLYAEDTKEITTDNVDELCGDIRNSALDEVIDYAMTGDMNRTLKAITKTRLQTGSFYPCIAALQIHLTRLHPISQRMQSGETIQSIISSTRPPFPFQRKHLIQKQIASWKQNSIEQAQSRTFKAVQDIRKNASLEESITRQLFLYIAASANRLAR